MRSIGRLWLTGSSLKSVLFRCQPMAGRVRGYWLKLTVGVARQMMFTLRGYLRSIDLPQAATLCGECHVVCPMKIPLPDLLRKLRERQFERGLRPLGERLGLAAWGFLARRPSLYRLSTRAASQVLRWYAGAKAHLRHVPGAGAWTEHRDLPAPKGKPFSVQWAQRKSTGHSPR